MLESERESALEVWESGACEVGGGGGEVVEEEGLNWEEKEPGYVEESEGERRRRDGLGRRRDGGALHHLEFDERSHLSGRGYEILL